jgi:outer membrane receptor protein involved in Fe transport
VAATGTRLNAGLAYLGAFRAIDVLAAFRCFGDTGPCHPTLRDFIISYPSITRLNASLTQRLSRQLEGFVSVDNLTNQQTYEGSNFLPLVGRTTTVGLRAGY